MYILWSVKLRLTFACRKYSNLVTDDDLGRVVRKPVNANLGLKVNRSINFSFLKMFFNAYVLGSLRLFKLEFKQKKTHQTVANLANPGLA